MITTKNRDSGIILGLMAFAGTLIVYVETMIVPAIPVFIKFFDTTYDNVSWVITAYIITGTVAAGIFGKLGDVFGKRRVFLILSLIYAIAVSFGGFATTLDELIAIRVIQGIGFGMFPLAYAIINDVVPKRELALAQGIMSATFAVGAGIGLVIGAYITEYFGWQWSYHSAIPVAFALFILSYFYLKDYAEPVREKIDFDGVALLGIPLVFLIFGLSEGQTYGWTSITIISMFILSGILFYIFVRYESNAENPFINIQLVRKRNVLIANFVGLFAMSGMYFLFFTVPTLLQDPEPAGFGKTILESGIIMLPATVMAMVSAPLASLETEKKGPKASMITGLSIGLISFIMLIFFRSTIFDIIYAAVVLGIGFSFILVGVINLLLISTPNERAGEATGMNTVFREIGMSIAPAIAGSIESMYSVPVIISILPYSMGSLNYIPVFYDFPSSRAFTMVYIIGIIFVIISIGISSLIKNTRGELNE